MFNPSYKITNRISSTLTAIARAKVFIDRAKLLPQDIFRLRKEALIRMINSSTAIEGNILDVFQVEELIKHISPKKIHAPAKDVLEVLNYLAALKFIQKVVKKNQAFSEKIILKIHRLISKNILPNTLSGHYRQGPIYVVSSEPSRPDELIYTGPSAEKVPRLMGDLVVWVNDSVKKEIHPILVAGVLHQEIAAIHPFHDGNGRTARVLATLILHERGYDFRRLIALEGYYSKARPKYYKPINIGKSYEERNIDFTPWLEYFVKGFKKEVDDAKEKILKLNYTYEQADPTKFL